MNQTLQNYCTENHPHTDLRKFSKGDTIYYDQTPSFGFYYISEGSVKIFTTDQNGREVIIRIATKGDIFGHEFFFGNRLNRGSVKAMENTLCQFLRGDDFTALMLKNSNLGLEMLKIIGLEMERMQDRYIDIVKKNVRERLASYFHYMAKNHSEPHQRGLRINLQLSREEIACMIGTANETTIRFISEFKELGLIKEENKYFHIIDYDKLLSIGKLN